MFTKPLHASDISPFISGRGKAGLRGSWRPREQRLNNLKRVRYVNTSADTDLSAGARGLHKGLRTEDVTSDRACRHSASPAGLMEAGAEAVAAL